MKLKTKRLLVFVVLATSGLIGVARADVVEAPSALSISDIYGPVEASIMQRVMSESSRIAEAKESEPTFKHGDISWLPGLAAQAGWPEGTWPKLGQIILRESGGCPNRRGGDVVDENCQHIRVSTWSHRSDTGLLQINGVNYNTKRNKWARVCLDLGVCTQEPLLDPLVNLKAGYLLYSLAGWDPWDPCAWGPEWAHRCVKGG